MNQKSRRNFLTALAALLLTSSALAAWLYVLNTGGINYRRGIDTASAITAGGNPAAGHDAIMASGCGACHAIPGVVGATGKVGPSLADFRQQATVAGVTANTANNLIRWLQNPQAVDPKTAMPNLGLTEQQARDIAAYLYAPR